MTASTCTATPWTVLELIVNNHPGVMSHICGLFSRRAFNVEGILCLPEACGHKSRILLTVAADDRLNQIIKQVSKLEDVHEVDIMPMSREEFMQLGRAFGRREQAA
jgi:acetolactate synthase-1/3 small subunit